MVGPIGRVVKLVSGGIGLAIEAHDARKQKKAQGQAQALKRAEDGARGMSQGSDFAESSAASATRGVQDPPFDEPPPEYIETTDEHADELIARGHAVPVDEKDLKRDLKITKVDPKDEEDDSDTDSDLNDEAEWALDEAAEAADPPSYEEVSRTASNNTLIDEVLRLLGPPVKPGHKIPYPVILPQRRPRDKGRGFVRAYAPVLGDCGITQAAFLQFLKNWGKASQADAYLNVIMLGAFAAGLVPEVWSQIAFTVVQVAVGTAQELQRRHRGNTFLDTMNQQVFVPRGLFAMVLTFKPDLGKNIEGKQLDINEVIAKYSKHDAGKMKEAMKDLRLSSGTTHGEVHIPQAAPLVYPALDEAALDESGKKQNSLKGTGKFIADYMDRRAQAKYSYYHPDSALATEPQHFSSRFSDPNHPVNSGHLISLITGGAYDPRARRQAKRDRRNQWRIARGRLPRQYRLPRDAREPKGLRRILQQNLLYLTIVNLPSDEEIAAARERLDNLKSHGSFMGAQSTQSAQGGGQYGQYGKQY